MGAPPIRVRRVYDPPQEGEGLRVLVDRLWPRGLTRAELRLDAWWRRLAPSDGLRRWLHAARARWPEFAARYRAELDALPTEVVEEALAPLRAAPGPLTLLTAARDPARSHVPVLQGWLEQRLVGGS